MIDDLRKWALEAPSMQVREAWYKQIDALAKSLESQASRLERLHQDVEAAERARDTASLARMRVVGQLNTLHKTLSAATPNFEGVLDDDPQHVALRRIEWLVTRGGSDPAAALAAKEAEMEAPMPGQAVLEAVIAGQRHFTKPQLEFSVSEAIVLTGWEMTPVEILAKGEPWLAELILKNHTAPAE
jgi:hypothetical protein